MDLAMRFFHSDEDFWRVRPFLRQVSRLNFPHAYSWEVARWDYWRWHVVENITRYALTELVALWETPAGEIAAVVNPDWHGEAFFQVHPGARMPELEEDMLALAEERLAVSTADGQRKLRVWAHKGDALRCELLERKGYTRCAGAEYQRRRRIDAPVPAAPLPPGYRVRALGDAEELPARSWLSWQAFHPDEPDENYQGWTWYPNVQRAPLYRRDLDLVAVAPDGTLAAFCTVWYDDVERVGMFEPVGTAPAYQRRGLGRAVMAEGLRRLANLGAQRAVIGSYSEAAGALYAGMGFVEYDLSEPWERVWG